MVEILKIGLKPAEYYPLPRRVADKAGSVCLLPNHIQEQRDPGVVRRVDHHREDRQHRGTNSKRSGGLNGQVPQPEIFPRRIKLHIA
jgi:hypothetical protein